jgi:putative secretion ATPase (PEP-CTERM system associated)
MYEKFYSLSGTPFQLTPDHRFFFGSAEHKKAMAFLEYGVAQREGFVVVTGEVGAGKTTLVEHLLATLNPSEHVAGRVVTTQLGGTDMLRMIAAAFGLPSEGLDKATLINRLGKFFAEQHAEGKRPLVIVDEAQSLTAEAIEELRMLSNLSGGNGALFQGILLGQPEFRDMFAGPNLTQFRQRVIASCHLSGLGEEDTRRYIEHRLHQVGWSGDPHFSEGAFVQIHRLTDGLPRRINSLCSRLLLLGFLEDKHTIDANAVTTVAEELALELKPLTATANGSVAQHQAATSQASADHPELISRVSRIESAMDRNNIVIDRMLDLALKYLPAPDAK